jgi:hypothetical protein
MKFLGYNKNRWQCLKEMVHTLQEYTSVQLNALESPCQIAISTYSPLQVLYSLIGVIVGSVVGGIVLYSSAARSRSLSVTLHRLLCALLCHGPIQSSWARGRSRVSPTICSVPYTSHILRPLILEPLKLIQLRLSTKKSHYHHTSFTLCMPH